MDGILAAYTVFAAACCASFGMLAGDRWRPETPLRAYLRDITFRPSRCDGCGRKIGAAALIPVLGYALARGRCPRCGHRVSPAYPAGEAVAAAFMAAALWRHGAGAAWLLPAVAGGMAAWRSDFATREVHEAHAALIASGSIGLWAWEGAPLDHIGCGALLLAVAIAVNGAWRLMGRLEAMPMGDLMLFAAVGPLFDLDHDVAFMALMGAAVAGVAAACRGDARPTLPLAPAMIAGAAVATLIPPFTIPLP